MWIVSGRRGCDCELTLIGAGKMASGRTIERASGEGDVWLWSCSSGEGGG
jgi:hypothetical protein